MALRVFLSSTFLEFKAERKILHRVITRYLSVAADMAEYLTCETPNLEEELKKWIDKSQIIVLLLGIRYGSTCEGISWTRKEIEYAKEGGKEILPYLKEQEIPNTVLDLDDNKRLALQEFVKYVRTRIKANIPMFETTEDLTAVVTKDLCREIALYEQKEYEGSFE